MKSIYQSSPIRKNSLQVQIIEWKGKPVVLIVYFDSATRFLIKLQGKKALMGVFIFDGRVMISA